MVVPVALDMTTQKTIRFLTISVTIRILFDLESRVDVVANVAEPPPARIYGRSWKGSTSAHAGNDAVPFDRR